MAEFSVCHYKIHIEIPILLLFFALMLSESVKTNLVIFRTCYITLGYNQSECALLGTKYSNNDTANLEKIVEPYAAVINMVTSMSEAFISAILCLFVGPWSDRFGRKPILILSVVGFFLAYVILSVLTFFPNVSPWYFALGSIPVLLTGGFSSYMTVALCYITDVTSEANRGLRMAVFEAVLSLGIFLGNITSSYLFAAAGYWAVFAVSGLCCLLGALFTIFFIPESLTQRETENKLKGLFQISNMGDMFKTSFKKRPSYERCTVLSCVIALTLFIVIINGDAALIFLYLREKFQFSLKMYTLYSAAHNITWILGTMIGVYGIHKLLKVPESVMILLGFISMLNGMLMQGLATKGWEIYTAAFMRSLGGVLSPMVRSLVSKIVPNEEVGKIFALIVTSESLFGMMGSPLYTAIYNATINIDASIFSFVSAGLYGVEILIAIAIIVMRTRKNSNVNHYDQLVNEDIQTSSREEVES